MKHSEPAPIEPAAIASQVRQIVAASVAGTTLEELCFLHRIEKLAALVALWGQRMNLTARPDSPKEIAFHVVDSLMPLLLRKDEPVLEQAFRGGRVLDLGSGAGFPGLVLASACAARFTLAEARRKRASFLSVAAGEMGLSNVEIVNRNLAAGHYPQSFDTVTARAFAQPGVFTETATAVLRPGGIAILFAHPSQEIGQATGAHGILPQFRRLEYQVQRGDQPVRSGLAIWRKD